MIKTLLLSAVILFLFETKMHAQTPMMSGCAVGVAQVDLDISNVRARLLTDGGMWRTAISAHGYEVPKGSGKNYLFNGYLWMGAMDNTGQLRLAAATYRQSGGLPGTADFWPGPIDTTTTDINASTCLQYDRFWKINRQDVINFKSGSAATADMINYPGNGTGLEAHFLAPFFDNNNDGVYNSADGDYPDFDFMNTSSGCTGCNSLHGDQAIWWVLNDVGNIHASTGNQLGIEIQCQAFAYASGDQDINNATFYQYKIINRNPAISLLNTWFGKWTDPDIDYYLDDFVGCDVGRGMGYAYNGVNGFTGGAIGIDFLEGPTADFGDATDNDRDSCVDCTWQKNSSGNWIAVPENVLPEKIKLSRFVYFTNDNTFHGNPMAAQDYYNYLRGIWRNGLRMTYGGTGYGTGSGATSDTCDFMFPGYISGGTSDPYNYGTYGKPELPWDEVSSGNIPGDRRMLQSVGPFTMLPGAVQCVTIGVPWADNPTALAAADDKLQLLADSCFNISRVVGINFLDKNAGSVYPNPVTDQLFIRLTLTMKKASITLYDATGKLVRQQNNLSGNLVSVSCKDLAPGVYFYSLHDRGELLSGKFIKQ